MPNPKLQSEPKPKPEPKKTELKPEHWNKPEPKLEQELLNLNLLDIRLHFLEIHFFQKEKEKIKVVAFTWEVRQKEPTRGSPKKSLEWVRVPQFYGQNRQKK